MAIRYSGCVVDALGGTITAPNELTYRYELRKRRRWNIGLRRHVMEPTGEITVFFPATECGRAVSCHHYPDWDATFAAVAKYSPIDAAAA